MDFLLPVALGILSAPLIFFGGGWLLYVFWQSHEHKQNKTWQLVVFCVSAVAIAFIAICAPVLVLLGFASSFDASCIKAVNERERDAILFWRDAENWRRQLYLARDADSPGMVQFGQRLWQYCPGARFRLGPIKDGRRELAIVQAYPHTSANFDRIQTLVEIANRQPGCLLIGVALPTFASTAVSPVEKSDLLFVARRNYKLIDVDVYSDAVIKFCDNGYIQPLDPAFARYLGHDLYATYLGKVTVKKVSTLKSNEHAQNIERLQRCFLTLMTKEERKELESVISSRPCVDYTLKSQGTFGNCKRIKNPALLHLHGCLAP